MCSCPTGKDSAALVTSDASDNCLAEALSLLLASQLVDQLLDPEPVSKGADASAITRRIPSWVVDANRPLRELLDSMRVELALPAVREPVALQAAIDQTFALARAEIGRERQQLMEQVSARLRGGTGSRTGKRQAGFLEPTDSGLASEVLRAGAVRAVQHAADLDVLFKRAGAGSPPMQLAPRVVALGQRRDEQRVRARAGISGAEAQGLAEDSRRTAVELLKLERALVLGGVATEFWKRALDNLGRRAAEYQALAARLPAVRDGLRKHLERAWGRLGVNPRDVAALRFMRACDLTRSRAEEAVLPGGGEAVVDAEKIVQVLTEVVRHAVERTLGSEGSGGDLATAVVGARLRERGLVGLTAVRDRVHEQILYGPGAEGDARRLALSLDARPRPTPVAGRGLLSLGALQPRPAADRDHSSLRSRRPARSERRA